MANSQSLEMPGSGEKTPESGQTNGIKIFSSSRDCNEDYVAQFHHLLEDEDRQKEYSERRKQLVESEQANSWYAGAKSSASTKEHKAAIIVKDLREKERYDPKLFGNQAGEAVPDNDTKDMGGRFLTNKMTIERSKLYHIAREMPKGCHLHIHFNSELHPQKLLQRAKEMDTMFIRSLRPLLSKSDLDETEIVFNVLEAGTESSNIFGASYNPEYKAPNSRPWMRFQDFCTGFENFYGRVSPGSKADPLEWIRSKAALEENDVYRDDQTLNG